MIFDEVEKEIENLKNKLDGLKEDIAKSHAEQFQWMQALYANQENKNNQIENRQMRIEKFFGISDETMPFEPIYSRVMDISPAYPEIFNKHGEPMQVWFIHDGGFAHAPNDRNSRYIIWDRYNYGLPIHFYTDNQIFQVVGKPKKKFAAIAEPRSILPQVYQKYIDNKEYVENNFDAFFTHDAEMLATFKNAKFAALCATVWYGKNMEGIMIEGQREGFSNDGGAKDTIISEDNYKRKTKNISIISSAKGMCPLHVLRRNLALHFIVILLLLKIILVHIFSQRKF